jgi:hypothetical protein
MSDIQVNACNFHPMRGHVEDGAKVRFASGETLTVRSAGVGKWRLVDAAGNSVGQAADGAYELTRLIAEREEAE